MEAIAPSKSTEDDFVLVDTLEEMSGVRIPDAVAEIRTADVLHKTVCEVADMCKEVKNFLGIEG